MHEVNQCSPGSPGASNFQHPRYHDPQPFPCTHIERVRAEDQPKCPRREEVQLSTRSSSSSLEQDRRVRVHPSDLLSAAKVSSRWISARHGSSAPLIPAVHTDEHHQEFNARTGHINPGTPLPVRVTVRPDRTFHFEVRTPQTSWLLLNAADAPLGKKGKRKGASKPGHEIAGTVSLKHVYEIAKVKQSELRLSGLSLDGLCKSIIYQARSIGINVVA